MIKTYLALGSNLDNPYNQLQWAVKQLGVLPQSQLIKVSSFIKTKVIGYTQQPDVLNAVVELDTQLSPYKLLSHIADLEKQRKRTRLIRFGPRTLDIDILLYGDLVLNNPDLTIPHPRMWDRDFVLIPLYEIAPWLRTSALNKNRSAE